MGGERKERLFALNPYLVGMVVVVDVLMIAHAVDGRP